MINFRNTSFIKSITSLEDKPEKNLPEFVFLGRSNVGKSSLINALTDNKKLCFTSSKPGHTRLLNYFEVYQQCYLVDAPGYGYSSAGKKHDIVFKKMMDEYFLNTNIKCVLLLIDGRREIGEDDIELYHYLNHFNLPFVVIVTKTDKLNQSQMVKCKSLIGEQIPEKVFLTSSINKKGIDELKSFLSELI